jgi:hypothetical protein
MTEFILEIGAGPKPKAKDSWPDAVVETMDADDQYDPNYVCDARMPPEELYGLYDHVMASHILEHIPYFETIQVLERWKLLLKDQGRLHIVVPSLEWAAEQILSETPGKAVLPHLYGGLTTKWDIHHAAFTMPHLRACLETAGIACVRARTGEYAIRLSDESLTVAMQHYVCGVDRSRHVGITN